MLRIQVLGKGLIPRGYGLAPRLDPFPADLMMIATILNTNGLTVNYIHPEDGKPRLLTKANVKRVYDTYGNGYVVKKPVVNTAPVAPVVEQPVVEKVEETKVEEPDYSPEEEVKEDTVQVVKSQENNKYNNNKNYHNNKGNNNKH